PAPISRPMCHKGRVFRLILAQLSPSSKFHLPFFWSFIRKDKFALEPATVVSRECVPTMLVASALNNLSVVPPISYSMAPPLMERWAVVTALSYSWVKTPLGGLSVRISGPDARFSRFSPCHPWRSMPHHRVWGGKVPR